MAEDSYKEIVDLLEDHEKRIKQLESKLISSVNGKLEPSKGKSNLERLAKRINVSVIEIENLFDVEDNVLTVINVLGENEKERTCNVSLTTLLGYKYFFGINEVLSKEIRRNIAENMIPINNSATYLNEIIPSLIRRKGKRKSPKTSYKLTTLGEVQARETIRKMIK